MIAHPTDAGFSSLAARRAHNPKVVGSYPAPAANQRKPGLVPGFFVPAASAFDVGFTPKSRHSLYDIERTKTPA
jgi:hypothetical protein